MSRVTVQNYSRIQLEIIVRPIALHVLLLFAFHLSTDNGFITSKEFCGYYGMRCFFCFHLFRPLYLELLRHLVRIEFVRNTSLLNSSTLHNVHTIAKYI